MATTQNSYLDRRGRFWYYVRRVPIFAQAVEGRKRITVSLGTSDIVIARQRRDKQAIADNAFWETCRPVPNRDTRKAPKKVTRGRYAELLDELATVKSMLGQVLHLLAEERTPSGRQRGYGEVGGAVPPKTLGSDVKMSEALKTYIRDIAIDEVSGKSSEQQKIWEKSKKRSVACFIEVNGDIEMKAITRDHARAVHGYWTSRIRPRSGKATAKGSTGKRVMGDLRRLYRRYFEHLGEETRENPFRNLTFRDDKLRTTEPFSDVFVQRHILKPGIFEGFNREGALLVYALIETGCRPSEISNMLPGNIRVDEPVPHIRVRATHERQLKSKSSARDIPLVGVSLQAMRLARSGFPHFRDRGYLLSSSLMKAFRERRLLPSQAHRIYSFRHSFEKRMLEAGLDHDLRCLLMGHKNPRPQYGDGGSLVWKRDQLLKIAHPVTPELLSRYPFVSDLSSNSDN